MNSSKKYIEHAEPGLFDNQNVLDKLTELGDPLAKLDEVIDWKIFDQTLADLPQSEPAGPGGRPAFRPNFMFKILIIQTIIGLSDKQTQVAILDRKTCKRFLHVYDADPVPDQNTIRDFREKLVRANLFERLFEVFNKRLEECGFVTRKGHIIDASFVEVPRQRNNREENAAIKSWQIPEEWKNDPKKLSHKDLDARWAKKNEETHYGYKSHVVVDRESKLIVRHAVTDAATHDSQALDEITRPGDPETWLDSAYSGEPCEKILSEKGIKAHVCEKGQRGNPLTKKQRRSNRKRSRVRARVEHVFAFFTGSMNAMRQRYIGAVRNKACSIFSNLVYNLARVEQIIRLKLLGRKTPSLS